MKTLIVKYLPSGANSNTKKLVDFFEQQISGDVEVLDLLKNPAPLFDENSMQSYYKRNYGSQKLNDFEAKLLEKNDKLIAQLKSADIWVMAAPMHNFGMPAAMKAYMDAVIFNGETFEMGKKMMAGKKALCLYTSGGNYAHDKFDFNYPNWDGFTFNAKINFGFMGFDDSEVICTSLRDEKTKEKNLNEAQEKIQQVVKKFYKN